VISPFNILPFLIGKVLVENDQVKEEWRKYMEKLLNRRTHGIMPQPVKK